MERNKVAVRINEDDPLGIVWQGQIRYFEDGGEQWNAHGLSFLIFL